MLHYHIADKQGEKQMFANTISENTRIYILRNSRLLERQMYSVLFEKAPVEMVIKAIAAYQNADGGFGNGIEPDLLTPVSTGIGMETAFYYLDMLTNKKHCTDQVNPLLQRAREWVEHSITENGIIPIIPDDVRSYPHQVWWLNSDETRILSLAGYLAKFNMPLRQRAKRIVARFADTLAIPDVLTEYNYPLFVYAVNETSFSRWDQVLDVLQQKLTEHIYEPRESYFLLTRYWYHFIDMMPEELVERQIERYVDSIEADGGMPNPYPELPWWRPIVTLDFLLILNRLELLDRLE
ncbi:MAG: hypothetical protein H8D65_00495 [Spirochaetes bacterium]|nr:hypothetical protein [Spirochaetota bacterium]MBL7006074.1 hypothetical protein [Spirochaetia bacterium]